jgi:hypothetical protein
MKMLTTQATKETMMASLRSPEDLAERLGLRHTGYQRELMSQFYNDVDPVQANEVPAQRTTEALALAALWRLLLIPGSACYVIAANRELESRFMGFMHRITTEIDPALTSMCNWGNGKHLKIGDAAGYELRFVSNKPAFLQGIHGDAVTWVILGAKSSDTLFGDTMKVVDSYRGLPGHRHIVMW